jgi:hypothetical protein
LHVWLWLSHFVYFVDHVVERLGDALGKVGKFAGLTNGIRLSRDGNSGILVGRSGHSNSG